jgi:MFS family permease
LTTLIAIFFVERLGRRFLLFTGSIVMTVCDLLIALFFVVLSGSAKGWTAIVFLFIFVAAFEASIGTLFWFVINEILPEEAKSIGAPVINAFQWLFNLILSFFFLVVVEYLGQSTMFWIFGGIGLACTVLLYFNLPRSLGTTASTINAAELEQQNDEKQQNSNNNNNVPTTLTI